MSQRFDYVRYDDKSTELQEAFKQFFVAIEQYADKWLIDSRPKSLLMTALEEAFMWTGKAIRDEQIFRNSHPEHVPERGS